MDKTDIKEIKSKEKARQKAKSCRPPKDSVLVDPISQPNTTLTFSMSGAVSKERWDKIFGKKETKKKNTNKKTWCYIFKIYKIKR